jgi:hypothetical protein
LLRIWLIILTLWTVTAPSLSAAPRLDRESAEQITAAQLKDYLTFVASDEMEGRDTPSRGLDLTAKFLATLLSRWGVRPAGDAGTFFQKITLRALQADRAGCAAELNGQKFVCGDDFVVSAQDGAGTASGPLVYVGDGWLIKATGKDSLSGLDVRGKIVLVSGYARRPPRGIAWEALKPETEGAEWAAPAQYAKRRGAVGIVYLLSEDEPEEWDALAARIEKTAWEPERLSREKPSETLPTLIANSALVKALFAGEQAEADAVWKSFSEGKPLPGFALRPEKRLTFTAAIRTERAASQNVVGVIEGRDPRLKNEYVGLSAHYDHIGLLPPEAVEDRINNGADDDGSGTVAVLAIAETLAKSKSRPKRSILLIWHAGEEKGLWGAEYFTRFPTVPLEQVTALINIDMIGRSKPPGDTDERNRMLTGPEEIYVVGATVMSTALESLCRRVNDRYLKLTYNYRYDNPRDPESIFTRSDHYLYALKGIPIVFFFDGVHEDYHQPGDQVEKIDFVKMEKVTRTIYRTVWELADLKSRPKVDRALPQEFKPQP